MMMKQMKILMVMVIKFTKTAKDRDNGGDDDSDQMDNK